MLNKAIFSAFFDNPNNNNNNLNKQNAQQNRTNTKLINLSTTTSSSSLLLLNNNNQYYNDQLNNNNFNNTNFLICNHYLYINNIFNNNGSFDIYSTFIIHKIIVSLLCALLGVFFIIVGYRFLKLSTFLTGFTMGTLIIYFILNEHRLLNIYENLIIAISIGILFALVSLLVQYIGIFLLGVTSSSILICFILVIIDLFYENKSIWLCISLLFFSAILIASLTLKFQKYMSILNTSCIGAALFTSGIDYFIERNYLVDHMYDLLKVNTKSLLSHNSNNNTTESSNVLLSLNLMKTSSTGAAISTTSSTSATTTSALLLKINQTLATITQQNFITTTSTKHSSLFSSLNLIAKNIFEHTGLCWYSWIVFIGFFLLFLIGFLMQALVTGKNYDHRDSWHQLIRNRHKAKSANLEKIRRKSHFNTTSEYHDDTLNINQSYHNNTLSIDDHTASSTATTTNISTNHDNSVTNLVRIPLTKPSSSSSSTTTNQQNINEKKTSNKQNNPIMKKIKLNPNIPASTSANAVAKLPKPPAISPPPPPSSASTSGIALPPPPSAAATPISAPSTIINELPTNKTKLPSLNHTPSNKPTSLSPLLNIKSKNLLKQQMISSKDNTEKFRYFYQIRRNNGDVLSKDFLNNLKQQQKQQQQDTQEDLIQKQLKNNDSSPQSTSSLINNNSKLNKNSSKKSTSSNSSSSTTTTMTRVN